MPEKLDVTIANEAIKEKTYIYDEQYEQLDGNAPLKYSTARLARAFGTSLVYFAMNWAKVIVNAVIDRLTLKGFDSGNDEINAKLGNIFAKYNINLDAADVHEACQVTGEGFLIVDKVGEDTDVYFNDPRMCHMFYDADRPKVKKMAAKKWTDGSMWFIKLYYADRIETWSSQSDQTYKLESTEPNDGIIPVFHFRTSRRVICGDLDPATISSIDAINKLFSDMMVAAEFEAFKMRVFITQQDPGELEVGPDKKIWIPARESDGQDSSVQELGGSTLDNFLKPMNDIAQSLAITTGTPRHYFMDSGSNVSGEALIVMEAPLVKKVQRRQEAYTPTWQEFAAYVLLLNGTSVLPEDLKPIWGPVNTEQPLTSAQIVKTEHDAGIPVVNSLRRLGADDADITQLEKDMAAKRPDTTVTQ